MTTYYCVTSCFYGTGRVGVWLTDTIEAEEMPENTSAELSDRDVYSDWFDSYDAAMEFIQEVHMC